MKLDDVVLGLALMVLVMGYVLLVLGLLVARLRHHVAHLAAVCTTLTQARQAAGGAQIRVDPAPLDRTADEVAPETFEDASVLPRTWDRWGLRS